MKTFYFIFSLIISVTSYAQDFNFLALGDTGKANEGQYKVGAAMAKTCAESKCEFATLLGDNFYQVGVTSADDPQFIEKFEKPYADVNVPFYVVLGNHDYGKTANDWKRGKYQIEYGKKNLKWVLPSFYYTFEKNDVLFIVLDSSRLFHDKDTKKQRNFVRDAILRNTKKWVVVLMHHTYLSNGGHGNAGEYDGIYVPPFSGSEIKKLMDKELCEYADLVITGHDHTMQMLPGNEACPKPLFVVSGAGATVEKLNGKNPAYYQKSELGFAQVKVSKNQLEVSFINANGGIEHTQVITK